MASQHKRSKASASTNGKLAIEYMDPARLSVADKNARTHSIKQIGQLIHSIQEFGFSNPILADQNRRIIAGHGRYAAALKLKLKSVPVIILAGLSETKRRALALADNRIALNANWDADILSLELKDLQKTQEIDVEQLGFTKQDLVSLLAGGDGEEKEIKYQASYAVIVELATEREQVKLLKRLTAEGFEVKALIA